MLTDQDRFDRDPAAIQQEIMELDRQLLELQPALEKAHEEYQQTKATYEVKKLHAKLIKERRSGLQSVLKSVSVL